ncbi:MiaB/RimO family radical SAM methylthiotransferase [Ruminococcaceae bacterium OttesenSCG-928-N02]|nr:MiaB/RimO family radical SAM methylthiotransferase [Ruminococcaceae bacterium OttesenSCG-928-N02]
MNEDIPTMRDSTFRAFVPIMYGCNNFCTYCVVPYVRGRERSRTSTAIYNEVKGLVEGGYKDITLLGQNVNSYAGGVGEDIDFPDLLNFLCEIPGEYRIRFMTSHPKDASHKLIDTIAAHPQLCNHIHLPVQSGNNRILHEMNRRYTVEHYMDTIAYARAKIPNLTLSSDIIVGFPGETAQEFEDTFELVEKIGYTQLFTFIYSSRVGTPAAEMVDETPREEKVARLMRLSEAQARMEAEMLKTYIGTRQRLLVEGVERGFYKGRLENDRVAHFNAPADYTGNFVWAHITGVHGSVLTAELENDT